MVIFILREKSILLSAMQSECCGIYWVASLYLVMFVQYKLTTGPKTAAVGILYDHKTHFPGNNGLFCVMLVHGGWRAGEGSVTPGPITCHVMDFQSLWHLIPCTSGIISDFSFPYLTNRTSLYRSWDKG